MTLFTPAWKKDDLKKALKAVEKCPYKETLQQIAAEAPSEKVRSAALKKLILTFSDDDAFCLSAVDQINDAPTLSELLYLSRRIDVRARAFQRLPLGAGEKQKLAIEMLNNGWGVDSALKYRHVKPDDLDYLVGYDDALLYVVTHSPIHESQGFRNLGDQYKDEEVKAGAVCRMHDREKLKTALDAIGKTSYRNRIFEAILQETAAQGTGSVAYDEVTKRVRGKIISETENRYSRGNAASMLINCGYPIDESDTELCDALLYLMRDDDHLVGKLGERGHPLAYRYLLKNAPRYASELRNYPTPETVAALRSYLESYEKDNDIERRYDKVKHAVDSLKYIYEHADDPEVKDAIKSIRHGTYISHTDYIHCYKYWYCVPNRDEQHGKGCHIDRPRISLYL